MLEKLLFLLFLTYEIWLFLSEELAISEGKYSQKRDFGVDICPDWKFQVQTGLLKFNKFKAWSTQLFAHHKHMSDNDLFFFTIFVKFMKKIFVQPAMKQWNMILISYTLLHLLVFSFKQGFIINISHEVPNIKNMNLYR